MYPFAQKPRVIWFADDDPDDVYLFETILKEVNPSALFTAFSYGEDLLKGLSTLPAPDLLFLDINMPCMNGQECLKKIRNQPAFKRLPIVVFTSSPRQGDVAYTYALGAHLFVHKPSNYTEIIKILEQVLTLNWSKPEEILEKHYINNTYVPFKVQ